MTLLCSGIAWAEVDGTTSVKETAVLGVRHHPIIKSLLYNREAVDRNLAVALGRFFPTLDLTSKAGFQQYSSSGTRATGSDDRHRTATDTTLTLTQNVFDGAGRYYNYKGSKARLTSAEHRLIDNVETVALDAVRAHVDVVRQRRLMNLASENIIAHQEVLDSIAERVAGGAGSKADEMQARGRVARAETTFITYKGDLAIAEAEYYRVTGERPGPLEDPEFDADFIPATLDQVLDTSVAHNPKILLAKSEITAADTDRLGAQSAMMPNIDIEVSSRNTNQYDGSDTYLQDNKAMLAFSWNLFSGGSDYNTQRSSEARYKQAMADYQDTSDDIVRQVATTWAEYETAVASIEKHMEALQYSMESRDMYLMQFNVGQRSLLDVLDSINEVFSNSVLLETAQSNRNFVLYKFLTLEGGLLNSFEMNKQEWESQLEK